MAENHIRFILNRKNKYTGINYTDDPTIMAWQLANEPRALINHCAYYKWIHQTSSLLRSLDKNHLVSIGSEGNAFIPFSRKFKKENNCPNIDYTTMHVWVQNWGWFDPEKPEASFNRALKKAKRYISRHIGAAKRLGKPIVLEEFGIARDGGSFDPNATTQWRDRYYQEIFSFMIEHIGTNSPIVGANFWAWAGEGRPSVPKAVWLEGDDFTGDPPFEWQGWYSVYNTDNSTIEILTKASHQFTDEHNKP